MGIECHNALDVHGRSWKIFGLQGAINCQKCQKAMNGRPLTLPKAVQS